MSAPTRSRRAPARAADGIFEPNMTPLIDVSLVLVVILMVATPLAFQSGLAVSTASASGQAPLKSLETRVELNVGADGSVQVNRDRVPRSQLAAKLGPLLAEGSSRIVVVRCADTVAHGVFVSVLDEARTLGATRIAVVGN
ncbi:MAG: biopolymer transporter ExbD [Candidatus Eisenbacteria bacterium]